MAADQEKEKPREQVRTERESVLERIAHFSRREKDVGDALAAAEKDGNSAETERLKKEREILSLERETFAYERDNTGAYVGERWGQDLGRRFGEKGERPIEMAPDGSVKERAEDKTSFTMVVAMGELDRMNKEGGQKAGDWALEHVTSVIESSCAAQRTGADGKAPSFEIYRSDGNAFSVEFRNMTKEAVAAVKKTLEEYREVSPKLKEAGIKEAPPLAVSELSHATMVAALDSYYKVEGGAEVGAEGGEAAALPDPAEVQRTMVDIVKTASTYNSEVQKYVSRCERMIEVVAKEGLTEHAAEFFDKYAKKGLAGTKFDSPKLFQELLTTERERLKQGRNGAEVSAEELVASLKGTMRLEFDETGKEYAAKWLATDRAVKSERDRAIVESVLKGVGEGSRVERVKQAVEQAAAAPRRAERGAAKEALPLSGKKILEEKGVAVKDAEERYGADSQEARRARAELELEKVKRDPSTGLERKRSYFFDVREKIKEGKECSSVFVDMAFLKYFDREGGTEVGNDAIRRAAGVLEEAVRRVMAANPKNRAKVCRFGGDEFSISVDGGVDVANEIKKAIEDVVIEAGAVPGGTQSKDTYRDQGLTFNIGIAGIGEMRAVEQMQRERDPALKEESEEDRVKRQSELMTDMADAALGPEKSLNRFLFLMAELQDARYPDSLIDKPDAKDWEKMIPSDASPGTAEHVRAVNKLIDYSEKAIYGLGKDLRGWASKIRKNEATLADFVADMQEVINEKVERSLEEKKTNKLVLDLVVQAKVNEKRLRDEIDKVEQEREAMSAELGREHEEVTKRNLRIDELNKKVEKLARDFIKGA